MCISNIYIYISPRTEKKSRDAGSVSGGDEEHWRLPTRGCAPGSFHAARDFVVLVTPHGLGRRAEETTSQESEGLGRPCSEAWHRGCA